MSVLPCSNQKLFRPKHHVSLYSQFARIVLAHSSPHSPRFRLKRWRISTKLKNPDVLSKKRDFSQRNEAFPLTKMGFCPPKNMGFPTNKNTFGNFPPKKYHRPDFVHEISQTPFTPHRALNKTLGDFTFPPGLGPRLVQPQLPAAHQRQRALHGGRRGEGVAAEDQRQVPGRGDPLGEDLWGTSPGGYLVVHYPRIVESWVSSPYS